MLIVRKKAELEGAGKLNIYGLFENVNVHLESSVNVLTESKK